MGWAEEREKMKAEKQRKAEEMRAAMNRQPRSQAIYANIKSDAKFIVISFFTLDTGYEEEVKNLIASCQKFGLSYYVEGIKSLGSWQANTHFKARFIRKMLDHLDCSVVFLDADAVVQQYPCLFADMTEDFGAYFKQKDNLLSGTLYFKNNVQCKDLLDAWTVANRNNSSSWEQQVLSDIIPAWKDRISIKRLPATYCQIFDLMKNAGDPVIEHFQASRRFKKVINNQFYGKLAILVPTKGRPQSITRLVESAIKTAIDPSRVRFYFCIPADDYGSRNIIKAMNNLNIFIIDEQNDKEVNLSKFWNQLYEASRDWADYFGFYGDDVEFKTQGWDNQIVEEFEKHRDLPWLVRTNDCYQTTMAVLFFTNRLLHEIAGYYLPEYYRNVDMDTHWSHITRDAGCHTFLDKTVTYHHSAAIKRAPMDDIHKGCRKFVKDDTERFASQEEEAIRVEMVKKLKAYIEVVNA